MRGCYNRGEMDESLLTDAQVDFLFRYPRGRSKRLAGEGRIPSIRLPDGAVRFRRADIDRILAGDADCGAKKGGPRRRDTDDGADGEKHAAAGGGQRAA